MINRSLARRLEQLEAFVLPSEAPQVYMRIHFVSPDGDGHESLQKVADEELSSVSPFSQDRFVS